MALVVHLADVVLSAEFPRVLEEIADASEEGSVEVDFKRVLNSPVAGLKGLIALAQLRKKVILTLTALTGPEILADLHDTRFHRLFDNCLLVNDFVEFSLHHFIMLLSLVLKLLIKPQRTTSEGVQGFLSLLGFCRSEG